MFRYGPPRGENYVVGRVLEAAQHPNADRLRVCTVDVGDGEPATIVCGAPNVAAGQTVAVARPGAQLPDGRTLGAAKLRGIVSEGMILADRRDRARRRPRGHPRARRRPAPGTPLARGAAARHRRDRARDHAEPPRLPDRLRRRARGCTRRPGRRSRPPPWARDPGTLDGEPRGDRDRRRVPRAVPALHRARVRGRDDRALAAVAARRGCSRPACARSRTSSTSPTTRCC